MKNRLDIQRSRKQIYRAWKVNLLKALIHQKIYDFKTPQKISKLLKRNQQRWCLMATLTSPINKYMHDKKKRGF